MASPAEVANDMDAHGNYWHRRDKEIARLCFDAALTIRKILAQEKVDGRSWGGLHRRLLGREGHGLNLQGRPDFTRARLTLEKLRQEARGS